MKAVALKMPPEISVLRGLDAGQWVNLCGQMYTMRDWALLRLHDLLLEGKTPPVELGGQLIYFVGPTPPAPGEVIGSAGPTTSRRMERFLPALLQAGVRVIMGKGPLSEGAVAELARHEAMYLSAAGGAGAYYGSKVRGAAVVAYADLGPEAIYSLCVENFPAVVAVDTRGNDLFAQGPAKYKKG
jgi:fumarate hydratase subunit beta